MYLAEFEQLKKIGQPQDKHPISSAKSSGLSPNNPNNRPQMDVNVSAAYSYLSVLTREQGHLPQEIADAQSSLQRHIATLASDPERAQNANPTPEQKPLLDLVSRILLRDLDLQEQVATSLTSRSHVVKTSEAVDELKSYVGTLPRVFQESNEPGRALMRYLCEIMVNYSTNDNISPATTRQLAKEKIFAPEGTLTQKGAHILSKLLDATVEFIRENQPDVIASLGREGVQVLSYSDRKAALSSFLERAVSSLSDDAIVKLSQNEDPSFEDEVSKEMAIRVKDLIKRAAEIAKEGNLITSEDPEVTTASELKNASEADILASQSEGNELTPEEIMTKQKVAELAKRLAVQAKEINTAPTSTTTESTDVNAKSSDNVMREAVAETLTEAIKNTSDEDLNDARNIKSDIDLQKEFEKFRDEENSGGRSNINDPETLKITEMLSSAAAAAKANEIMGNTNNSEIPLDMPKIINDQIPDEVVESVVVPNLEASEALDSSTTPVNSGVAQDTEGEPSLYPKNKQINAVFDMLNTALNEGASPDIVEKTDTTMPAVNEEPVLNTDLPDDLNTLAPNANENEQVLLNIPVDAENPEMDFSDDLSKMNNPQNVVPDVLNVINDAVDNPVDNIVVNNDEPLTPNVQTSVVTEPDESLVKEFNQVVSDADMLRNESPITFDEVVKPVNNGTASSGIPQEVSQVDDSFDATNNGKLANLEKNVASLAEQEINNPANASEEPIFPKDQALDNSNVATNEGSEETGEEKKGILARFTSFIGRGAKVAPQQVQANPEPVPLQNVKNVTMEGLMRSFSSIAGNNNVTPEVRQMASSIHDAMMNPLGDLQAVSEWLGFMNAPLSATGSRAQSMQQWALMLLSIRFRQLGKNIEKFSHTESFKEMLKNIAAGSDDNWSSDALKHTLTQIERLQQMSQDDDIPGLPSYIPLPPSYEEGREGGLLISHEDNADNEREWHLSFFFELPDLGPLQIRAALKVPELKVNIVTEKLKALEKIKSTSETFRKHLSDCGFDVSSISSRMGTIYPPHSSSQNIKESSHSSSNNDVLSVNI